MSKIKKDTDETLILDYAGRIVQQELEQIGKRDLFNQSCKAALDFASEECARYEGRDYKLFEKYSKLKQYLLSSAPLLA